MPHFESGSDGMRCGSAALEAPGKRDVGIDGMGKGSAYSRGVRVRVDTGPRRRMLHHLLGHRAGLDAGRISGGVCICAVSELAVTRSCPRKRVRADSMARHRAGMRDAGDSVRSLLTAASARGPARGFASRFALLLLPVMRGPSSWGRSNSKWPAAGKLSDWMPSGQWGEAAAEGAALIDEQSSDWVGVRASSHWPHPVVRLPSQARLQYRTWPEATTITRLYHLPGLAKGEQAAQARLERSGLRCVIPALRAAQRESLVAWGVTEGRDGEAMATQTGNAKPNKAGEGPDARRGYGIEDRRRVDVDVDSPFNFAQKPPQDMMGAHQSSPPAVTVHARWPSATEAYHAHPDPQRESRRAKSAPGSSSLVLVLAPAARYASSALGLRLHHGRHPACVRPNPWPSKLLHRNAGWQ
ncbi:hypothetical protein DAEQUDRAFT_740674 [Daedalea quercina L-15889]|uniref:Uncharacterized protein n=1 Tax=Daedalea quercina L-15889 TaxID=1314783 RepID=A0A165M9Z7_9APHY|nr:hypothetical protein DAEQUDRAFT_740674 [Daedalea quercina L-15889]